jgi:hypothetical protein
MQASIMGNVFQYPSQEVLLIFGFATKTWGKKLPLLHVRSYSTLYRAHSDINNNDTVQLYSATDAVKKQILEVCGSLGKARKLASLAWGFVMGEHQYNGDLDLSQQIAYLELVMARISTRVDCDE